MTDHFSYCYILSPACLDVDLFFVREIRLEPFPEGGRILGVADVHEAHGSDVRRVAVVHKEVDLLPGQLQRAEFEEKAVSRRGYSTGTHASDAATHSSESSGAPRSAFPRLEMVDFVVDFVDDLVARFQGSEVKFEVRRSLNVSDNQMVDVVVIGVSPQRQRLTFARV